MRDVWSGRCLAAVDAEIRDQVRRGRSAFTGPELQIVTGTIATGLRRLAFQEDEPVLIVVKALQLNGTGTRLSADQGGLIDSVRCPQVGGLLGRIGKKVDRAVALRKIPRR